MHPSPPPVQPADTVAGNAPPDAKARVLAVLHRAINGHAFSGFAQAVARRIVVVEVAQEAPRVGGGKAVERRVVCEVGVEGGASAARSMFRHSCAHGRRVLRYDQCGGLDPRRMLRVSRRHVRAHPVARSRVVSSTARRCSSLCLIAAGRTEHVSQALNMVYHAPAPPYVVPPPLFPILSSLRARRGGA